MVNKLIKLFISDIKCISRTPILLCALLSPVIFTLILLYLFPFVSGLTRFDDRFFYDRYYSLTAITLISAVPFIYGLLFSWIHLTGSNWTGNKSADIKKQDAKKILIARIANATILSFIMVLPVIYITSAVSTEGWLRSIYAAFLLAIAAPFIFILSVGFARDRKSWKIFSLIAVIFLIALPSGLLLHHPWNYFIFFSPFYWTGWAWVIASPAESMVYGMISLAITTISGLICYQRVVRKSGNG